MTQQKMYNEDFLKTAGVFAIESGFDNNYIFIALLLYQALNFSKRKYTNFKSYFTKLSLFEIIFLVYVFLFFVI